ncbi:hypothetical protein E7V67_026120 [[Empedobacter] haloabium]|uniref:Uncharacterized protein n=1 Tax=[Empedobacter] haloabium TaxID=592317 RepID=A0ABZ1UM39_9BURK
MNWKIWGPLSFTIILFTVASAIKLFTFNESTFYVALAPELSLWATGVFFSFAVSEQVLFGVRTECDTRQRPGSQTIEVTFRVAMPGQPLFSPRFMYLFIFCMALWILNILLSGKADALIKAEGGIGVGAGSLVLLSTALAAFSVGLALRSMREVG